MINSPILHQDKNSSQCFNTDMIYEKSTFVLLSLGLCLFWWNNSPQGIIHPVVSVSVLTCFRNLRFSFSHCVDTFAGWLLIPEGIICPVVSALELTWFTR
jgi:hypothetical protein